MLWQIPQYFFLAVAEILISITVQALRQLWARREDCRKRGEEVGQGRAS